MLRDDTPPHMLILSATPSFVTPVDAAMRADVYDDSRCAARGVVTVSAARAERDEYDRRDDDGVEALLR